VSQPPGTYLGPYRILQHLRSGGMGEVYEAADEGHSRRVAIKLLNSEAATESQVVARFLQEARVLELLKDSGVVKFYHSERLEDGRVYLAMEHLVGQSLRDLLQRRGGRLPFAEAASILKQVADTLVIVHAKGIVHRDLKPENIFLVNAAPGEPVGQAKLIDFGIAKVPEDCLTPHSGQVLDTQVQTRSPVLLGTPFYMAPEQCKNAAAVTGRSDVYTLGVVLFEVLAGRRPFLAEDALEVMTMHLREEPPDLCEFAPDVPVEIALLVAMMLDKDPARRPTIERVGEALAGRWSPIPLACPLPGLQPFSSADVEIFFGRDSETQALCELLGAAHAGQRRWVLVSGASGAGKTSVVQAGVLPRLRAIETRAGPLWRIAVMRPGSMPLCSLAAALATAFDDAKLSREETECALGEGAGALRALVSAHSGSRTLLLVIEQMEELFTLGVAAKGQFDALLAAALAAPAIPICVLSTLRSDFLHCLDQLSGMARLLNGSARYHIGRLDNKELQSVVEGMARQAGLRLAGKLAERIVRDASVTNAPLALLGHALRTLWLSRQGVLVTHEQYDRIGGVAGALSTQVEQFLGQLGPVRTERVKWMLLDLVQLGHGITPATRRPRMRKDLLRAGGDDSLAEEVLHSLTSSDDLAAASGLRLLIPIDAHSQAPDEQLIELVHETLLTQVPFLVRWIAEERNHLERLHDLENMALAWEHAGYPNPDLGMGYLFDRYRGYADGMRQVSVIKRMASERAKRFLDATHSLEQRWLWFRRTFYAVAAVFGLMVFVSAAVAQYERARAQTSAATAVYERHRAQEHLRHVLQAAERLVSETDWALAQLPHTLPVRRDQLISVEKMLLALPTVERSQPDVLLMVVKVLHRRGDLELQSGQLKDAGALFETARVELARGPTRDIPGPELRKLLALNYSKRGKVALAGGRLSEAKSAFAEAVALLERGSSEPLDEDDYRTLSTSYLEQADALLAAQAPREAVALYEKAAAQLERTSPSNYNHALLGITLIAQSDAAIQAGALHTAAASLARAGPFVGAAVQSDPANLLFRSARGRLSLSQASLHLHEGALHAAARELADAVDVGRALHEDEPDSKAYTLLLGLALQRYEAFLSSQGDTARAETLKTERCNLIAQPVSADSEDVRFQALACAPLLRG